MPRISFFYGISIWMYYDESQHQGRPHFHARYGDDEASIGIGTGAVIAGGLPSRALRMVHEWSNAHETELLDNSGARPDAISRCEPWTRCGERSTLGASCAPRRS